MKCQDAAPLISAAHDGALDETQRAALEQHLAGCATCRAWQAELTATMDSLRREAGEVPLPDVEAEWRAVQARLNAPNPRARLAPITWIALPLAAAAAVAVAFFIGRTGPLPDGQLVDAAMVASADFVDVGGRDATPVVYLDKDSGVLVVWAVDNAKGAVGE